MYLHRIKIYLLNKKLIIFNNIYTCEQDALYYYTEKHSFYKNSLHLIFYQLPAFLYRKVVKATILYPLVIKPKSGMLFLFP